MGLVVVVEGLLGEVAGGAVGVLVGLVELGVGELVDVVPAVDGAADRSGAVEGVVGVGDGLLRQFDRGGYGVGVRAECAGEVVAVRGRVRAGERAFRGRDHELGGLHPAVTVVTEDLLRVGRAAGAAHVAGGGGGLALLQRVVRPGGQLVAGRGRHVARGVVLGLLAAHFVVLVADGLVAGVGRGQQLSGVVVGGAGGAGVGVCLGGAAPEEVVAAGPGVSLAVVLAYLVVCRVVGVGDGVGGARGCSAVVAQQFDRLAAGVGVGGGGGGAVGRGDVDAVGTGVGGGGAPRLRSEVVSDRGGHPARAVVDRAGLGRGLVVRGVHQRARGGTGVVVRVRGADRPAVAVVDGVGDGAAAVHGGRLCLTRAQQRVVDRDGGAVGVVVVEGLGGDRRRSLGVEVVAEFGVGVVVGGEARVPDGGEAAEGVVGAGGGVSGRVGGLEVQASGRVERGRGGEAGGLAGDLRLGDLDGGRGGAGGGGVDGGGDVAVGVGLGEFAAVGVVGVLQRGDVVRGSVGGDGVGLLHHRHIALGGRGGVVGGVVEERQVVAEQVIGVGRSVGAFDGDFLDAARCRQQVAAGVGGVPGAGALVVLGGRDVTLVVHGLGQAGGVVEGVVDLAGLLGAVRFGGGGAGPIDVGAVREERVQARLRARLGGGCRGAPGVGDAVRQQRAAVTVEGLRLEGLAGQPVGVLLRVVAGAVVEGDAAGAGGGLVAVHAAEERLPGQCDLRRGCAGAGLDLAVAAPLVPGAVLGLRLRVVAEVPGRIAHVRVGGLDGKAAARLVLLRHRVDDELVEPVQLR
ncbi:hypothetical protein SO3561_10515 [Streptomyces olivochromogenes]|uniref:Uncharacterized protein n=1 Tax=Streptomyces olivochromogenes TaxID=1963 RepID=A0A286PHB1_STROL|nr:hypothetical protein SO3561_10515 [Streptomyces olivochromogenes]